MKVLFFDPVSPHPYTANSLTSRPMGASEGSLMRVARGLAALPDYAVAVFQLCDAQRTELTVQRVKHLNQSSCFVPDVVVHQRTARFVEELAKEYPKARHIVWMHDLGHESWLKDEHLGELGENLSNIVCVSDFHVRNMSDQIAVGRHASVPGRIIRIYNPVDFDGVAPSTERVPGRLGFFSSPQKGLAQVADIFARLRKDQPELELVVANPGYLPDVRPDGVRFLGQLPHPLAMKELSKCQVLFYPQTVFPETMGVVLAEANALGVPVLAHDMGAAKEVLESTAANQNSNVVVDCTKPEEVSDGLASLLEPCWARPQLDMRFALSSVIAEWRKLLEGTK